MDQVMESPNLVIRPCVEKSHYDAVAALVRKGCTLDHVEEVVCSHAAGKPVAAGRVMLLIAERDGCVTSLAHCDSYRSEPPQHNVFQILDIVAQDGISNEVVLAQLLHSLQAEEQEVIVRLGRSVSCEATALQAIKRLRGIRDDGAYVILLRPKRQD